MSETRGKQGPKKKNVEEIKQKKNGLDIWSDIEQWAQSGFESIPDDQYELLKWYGIYRQKPNEGHFMLRVRLPGGQMNVEQARTISQISREFGRDTLDITVRQNFQIHWLTIEEMPEIQRRLAAVGVTSVMACGDVPRNIVGCPLSGRYKHEIIHAQPALEKVDAAVAGNKEFSNLPRKFKMSISGCDIMCPQPEIHDIGLYGAIKTLNGKQERGFNLIAGGGLSTRPYLGKVMNAFVPEDKVVDVCLAITSIFRDMGNRDSRKKARMKFLVEELGAEKFRQIIEDRLGHALEESGEVRWNPHAFRDHVGIGEQQQPGLYYMGYVTNSGRISPDDLFIAADIAESCGSGWLANSCMQNLLIPDVAEEKLDEAKQRGSKAPTITADAHQIRKGLVVCTGSEFCNLAVTETKNRAKDVLAYLEEEIDLDTPLKIAISGCPNSCSQYQTADIGLRGGKSRKDGEQIEAYDIFVGSEMGEEQQFNKQAIRAVPAGEIGPAIAKIIKKYKAERKGEETFQEFANRYLNEGGKF